ncbi:MAG TPA: hypothetical protein VE591_00370, partial [Candidatus Acidoferrum sp.]|nr:hypothetical protein [Candidatus Acidoferrum sp.]
RTDDQRLAAAVHDLHTGRYNIAAIKLTDLLKKHPDDAEAQFELGQAQLALGQVGKGEQNLAAAAAKLPPEAKALADMRIHALRAGTGTTSLLRADWRPLRDQMAIAQTAQQQAATAIETRRKQGVDQLKTLHGRIQEIVYGVPDMSRLQPRKDSRLDAVMHNITTMSKSLSTAVSKSSEAIGGVGSLERGKEAGMLKEDQDILNEMNAPLKLDAPPPQALATLRYYPRMLNTIAASDSDMVRGVDAARASLALLDVSLGDLDAFVTQLRRSQFDASGDISTLDYRAIEPLMTKAVDSLNKAAVGATQASQLYNMARSRQLEVRIDMLGLAQTPDRYATLQHALDLRFHTKGLDYDQLPRMDVSPGEVVAATIVGADTNAAAPAILAEAKAKNQSIVDVANSRGMFAQSLEIFMGLIFLAYTDDPVKEIQQPLT